MHADYLAVIRVAAIRPALRLRRLHLTRRGRGMNEIEKARCRSAVYEALALGFSPPTAEVLKRLATSSGRSELAQQLAEIGFPGELDFRIREGSLAERYQQLFGRAGEDGVWPYQTHYDAQGLFSESSELVDLRAFATTFGLETTPSHRERADHVSSQCEFMAMLRRKEAEAIENDDLAMREKIRKAEAAFLHDHLGQFALFLGAQLERIDSDDFYGELGGLLKRFVEAECAELGVLSESQWAGSDERAATAASKGTR